MSVCVCVCVRARARHVRVLSRSAVPDSLRPHGLWPAWLLCPWGFSRQEYQSELPCPSPGDRYHPGTKPLSVTSPAFVVRFFTTSATKETYTLVYSYQDK